MTDRPIGHVPIRTAQPKFVATSRGASGSPSDIRQLFGEPASQRRDAKPLHRSQLIIVELTARARRARPSLSSGRVLQRVAEGLQIALWTLFFRRENHRFSASNIQWPKSPFPKPFRGETDEIYWKRKRQK